MRRVLIANRGEIALRITRACRQLGLEVVAAYTQADSQLRHLELVDDAVCIGAKSYLEMNNLLMAARNTGCDAVHPGYGYLAENAEFAAEVEAADLIFIGSTPEQIRQLGDKVSARQLAAEHGLSGVPGTTVLEDTATAATAALQLGYPVLLKAAAGGGGRGMRQVHDESELSNCFAEAQLEAEAFFADDRLYMEKYFPAPRHVEVQVLGDGNGLVIHRGSRDCSIQRRHQKLLEEAPAPFIDENLLSSLCNSAVEFCSALSYRGAGTLEFLYQDGQFYFIEMNTRIQVEHPVTEAIFGDDLIVEQLKIAAGEFEPDSREARGHAIECRLVAEDAHFNASPGMITSLHWPGGPGIRVDSHLYQGYEVPHQYDSLIAKLIAWGVDRQTALARMRQALLECRIEGIETNQYRLLRLLDDERLKQGNMHTHMLEVV